jgi:nitrite reductase/ring-hydroxylating ferredoxin subunit
MNLSTDWVRIASTSDVPEGEARAIEIMGLNLALYHVGDAWFCTDNVCTHAFALLTDGWLEEHTIECPLHGGQFDIRTGKGLCAPIVSDLKTFPIQIDGEDILITLS